MSVPLCTSIFCASCSYGVSQPCLYLPLGYFLKKTPSHKRIMLKTYNPLTNDENGRAENWAGSIKFGSHTFQSKLERKYDKFFENKVGNYISMFWLEIFVVCFSSYSPCVCLCFLSVCRIVVFLLKLFPETYFHKIHEWLWFMTVSFKFALVIS